VEVFKHSVINKAGLVESEQAVLGTDHAAVGAFIARK